METPQRPRPRKGPKELWSPHDQLDVLRNAHWNLFHRKRPDPDIPKNQDHYKSVPVPPVDSLSLKKDNYVQDMSWVTHFALRQLDLEAHALVLNGFSTEQYHGSSPGVEDTYDVYFPFLRRISFLHLNREVINGFQLARQSFRQLQHLRINHCNIRDTGWLLHTFYGDGNCPLLETLDLSHNLIETIPRRFFSGCDRITFLNVSHNRISRISGEFTPNPNYLHTLDLSYNALSSMQDFANLCNELPSLIDINLSNNNIAGRATLPLQLQRIDVRNNPGCFLIPPEGSFSAAVKKVEILSKSIHPLHPLPPRLLYGRGLSVKNTLGNSAGLPLIADQKFPVGSPQEQEFSPNVSRKAQRAKPKEEDDDAPVELLHASNPFRARRDSVLTSEWEVAPSIRFDHHLDLAGIRIHRVDEQCPHLWYGQGRAYCRSLDLSHCEISVIEVPSVFNIPPYFTALTSLHLPHNGIESFPFLEGLSTLHSLDLSFNRIRFLDASPMQYISSLTNLVLCGNFLEELPSDSFTALKSLKHLDISRNLLHTTAKVWFPTTLHELDLSHNRISSSQWLYTNGVVDLRALRVLRLNHNSLDLPPFSRTLRVANGFTMEIEPSCFNLEVLDLSFNHLSYFDDCVKLRDGRRMVSGMSSLRFLNLAFNELKDIKAIDFLQRTERLPALQQICLEGNAIMLAKGQRLGVGSEWSDLKESEYIEDIILKAHKEAEVIVFPQVHRVEDKRVTLLSKSTGPALTRVNQLLQGGGGALEEDSLSDEEYEKPQSSRITQRSGQPTKLTAPPTKEEETAKPLHPYQRHEIEVRKKKNLVFTGPALRPSSYGASNVDMDEVEARYIEDLRTNFFLDEQETAARSAMPALQEHAPQAEEDSHEEEDVEVPPSVADLQFRRGSIAYHNLAKRISVYAPPEITSGRSHRSGALRGGNQEDDDVDEARSDQGSSDGSGSDNDGDDNQIVRRRGGDRRKHSVMLRPHRQRAKSNSGNSIAHMDPDSSLENWKLEVRYRYFLPSVMFHPTDPYLGLVLVGPKGNGQHEFLHWVAKSTSATILDVRAIFEENHAKPNMPHILKALYNIALEKQPALFLFRDLETLIPVQHELAGPIIPDSLAKALGHFFHDVSFLMKKTQVNVAATTTAPMSCNQLILSRFAKQLLFLNPNAEERMEYLDNKVMGGNISRHALRERLMSWRTHAEELLDSETFVKLSAEISDLVLDTEANVGLDETIEVPVEETKEGSEETSSAASGEGEEGEDGGSVPVHDEDSFGDDDAASIDSDESETSPTKDDSRPTRSRTRGTTTETGLGFTSPTASSRPNSPTASSVLNSPTSLINMTPSNKERMAKLTKEQQLALKKKMLQLEKAELFVLRVLAHELLGYSRAAIVQIWKTLETSARLLQSPASIRSAGSAPSTFYLPRIEDVRRAIEESEAVSTDLLNKECYRWGKEINAEFPAPPSDHEAVEEVWEMLKEDKKIQREMRHTWSMKKQIIQDMQANLQKRDASEIIAEEVFKWKEAQRVKKKAKKRRQQQEERVATEPLHPRAQRGSIFSGFDFEHDPGDIGKDILHALASILVAPDAAAAAFLVWRLSLHDPAPRYREFFSAGVIAVLRTTVAQFPHSPLVALRCVEFLETVARLGGAQVRLVQEKGPDLAALAMDQHTGYPPLFRTAATVLAVTAASGNYNPVVIEGLRNSNALVEVVKGFGGILYDPISIAAILVSMHTIALHEEGAKALVEAGAVERSIAVMAYHGNDSHVITAGLKLHLALVGYGKSALPLQRDIFACDVTTAAASIAHEPIRCGIVARTFAVLVVPAPPPSATPAAEAQNPTSSIHQDTQSERSKSSSKHEGQRVEEGVTKEEEVVEKENEVQDIEAASASTEDSASQRSTQPPEKLLRHTGDEYCKSIDLKTQEKYQKELDALQKYAYEVRKIDPATAKQEYLLRPHLMMKNKRKIEALGYEAGGVLPVEARKLGLEDTGLGDNSRIVEDGLELLVLLSDHKEAKRDFRNLVEAFHHLFHLTRHKSHASLPRIHVLFAQLMSKLCQEKYFLADQIPSALRSMFHSIELFIAADSVLIQLLHPLLAMLPTNPLVGKHIVARPPWIDLLQQALQRHQTNHDILTTIGDIVALLSAKAGQRKALVSSGILDDIAEAHKRFHGIVGKKQRALQQQVEDAIEEEKQREEELEKFAMGTDEFGWVKTPLAPLDGIRSARERAEGLQRELLAQTQAETAEKRVVAGTERALRNFAQDNVGRKRLKDMNVRSSLVAATRRGGRDATHTVVVKQKKNCTLM